MRAITYIMASPVFYVEIVFFTCNQITVVRWYLLENINFI